MQRPSLLAAGPPAESARPYGPSRLHRALDALMEAFWLLDAVRDDTGRITDFVIVELNLSAACMAGLDPGSARGRLLGEVVPLARRLGHIDRYAAVVASGRPEIHQFSVEKPDAPTVWRRIHAVRSGDGVVVTITDVTDRVVHERERAVAEDDLRLLTENATDMIARMTPDGRLTYVSPGCREVVGFEPDEMVGLSTRDLAHVDDLPALEDGLRLVELSPEARCFTYRARRKRGGWVRLETTARGVRDAGGTLREIQLATRDVTERTLAEAEHAALHRVSEAVAEGVHDSDLYMLVAGEMAHLLDADGGRVVRYTEDGAAEVLGAWRRPSLPQTRPGERLVLSPGWAITRAHATGATAVAQLSSEAAARAGADLRLGIAAPVRFEGRVWGAVAAAFRDPEDMPDGAPVRVERFAKLVGLAVANAEARGRLTVQATTDALTGLANHGTFHTALGDAFARAARYGGALSLVVIDLDHFKAVNDTFGHLAGDAALAAVGAILREHAREADVVGRIGGEEFGWLMPETGIEGAVEAAERLRRAIASAPVCGPMGLTTSLGVTCRMPRDQDAEHLFRRADAALYRAKQGGRDRVVAERS